MATEIERKFLVQAPPTLDGPGRLIEQGYIALDPDGTEVRIRREPGRPVLAVKRGGGMVRTEIEIEVDQDTADLLWALTGGRRLTKTRYVLPVAGHRAEVDIYAGPLSGLVVVEVEFEDEHAARAFIPPDWFGREVTGEPAFRNNVLAKTGKPPG